MIDTKDTKTRKPRKFLFDQNCFDDDFEEEIVEEEPPPPPVFSEAELAAAEQRGYDQGKKDGLAEAEASREKQVAKMLDTISRNFQTLFDAEQQRYDQYEGEAVALAHTIFGKLFPTLNEKQGLAEIETVIRSVLESQKVQHEITIEVHPDYADSVRERLEAAAAAVPGGCKASVTGKSDLGPGDCRMHWNNGGAGRNATFLAEEIHRQLEHILADRPTLQDNGVIEDKTDQQPGADQPTDNGEN